MKRVLLFGTGEGSRQFLIKYKNELKIVGILDNDKNKHGKLFLDDLVISSPLLINQFDYEQVIIVSQWAKEIYTQLVNDLGVDTSKIYIPEKSSIKEANKPFEDVNTRELARNIIKQISFHAFNDKVPVIVDFGTLLGIIRDNDVIEWDDDVDFSIANLSEDFDFPIWITDVIKKIDLPVNLSLKYQSIDNKPTSIILNFETKEFRQFLISISLRELKNNNYIHLPSGGMWYAPKKHFDNYEIIDWQGCKVFVPYDYENYLTFLYGNWKIPKKNITMADYANLGKVDYEIFKDLGTGYKELK